MADEIVCPECDERVEVRPRDRAKGLNCSACGTRLLAPNPEAARDYRLDLADGEKEKEQPKKTEKPKIKPRTKSRKATSDEDEPFDAPYFARLPRTKDISGYCGCFLGVILLSIGGVLGGNQWIEKRQATRARAEADRAQQERWNNRPPLGSPAGDPGTGLPALVVPFDVDPLLEKPDRPVYLADMQEFGVQMGPWRLGKGEIGDSTRTPIKVRERLAPKGLGAHPSDRQTTRVCYALGGRAEALAGSAGLNDGTYTAWDAVVFTVVGDGRELWRSKKLTRESGSEEFNIDVSGVKVLELRATAQGSHLGMHAVWIDPVIEK